MATFRTVPRSDPLPVREPAIHPVHAGRAFCVTGGAGGLGRALAELLVAEGAEVLITDLDADRVSETAKAVGCAGLALDLAAEDVGKVVVDAMMEHFGRIDGLVTAAGLVLHGDPLMLDRAHWQRQFDVNLHAAYDPAAAVARAMAAAGTRGAIVTVASEAGKVGHVHSMAYSASKAAVINMTRMLSAALAPHDINVNCVCPGGMATPMLREVADAYADVSGEDSDEIWRFMGDGPLGRHTEPREVARVISFLLSDAAFLIRGQAINADAGLTPY